MKPKIAITNRCREGKLTPTKETWPIKVRIVTSTEAATCYLTLPQAREVLEDLQEAILSRMHQTGKERT